MAAGLKAVGSTAAETALTEEHQVKERHTAQAEAAATASLMATAKDVLSEAVRETLTAAEREGHSEKEGARDAHTETMKEDRLSAAKEAIAAKEEAKEGHSAIAREDLTEKEEEKETEKQTQEPSEMPFTDTKDHWANDAIRFVYKNGLMAGTGETTFEPETTGIRGMIMTILHNLDGNQEYFASHSFADVENEKYYSGAISWAVASGIVSGYGNGQFGPDDDVTREQLAVILRQYAKVKGYDVSKSADLSTFVDADQVSPWAQDALKWACGQGLISGKGGRVLDPGGRATRAEVATILMNFMEKVAK